MAYDIEEAKRRAAESDRLFDEHEAAQDGDRARYNRICHLRQTAAAIALIGVCERIEREADEDDGADQRDR